MREGWYRNKLDGKSVFVFAEEDGLVFCQHDEESPSFAVLSSKFSKYFEEIDSEKEPSPAD